MRHARPADLPHIALLAAEHAAYEKAVPPPADEPQTTRMTAARWDGAEYLHMDCLFLRDGHRGLGVGPKLVDAVLAEARARGLGQVQWQTPPWNKDAIRFYDRLGAQAKEKRRYFLSVD